MTTSLFAYGFRPNFLLAGLAGLVLVPLWALSIAAGIPLTSGWPPTLWHGHELLFGFVSIAIAGFLLTAVPSWTGGKGFAGRPLVLLASVWIGARLLIATSAWWPPMLPAVVDLAFLPALAALIARPLFRAHNRNTPLFVVLGLLWLANVTFHFAVLRTNVPLARHALIVGIDVMLVLVTVIGGRIVPAFTTAALREAGGEGTVRSRPLLTILAVASMVLVAIGDIAWPDRRASGYLAVAASLIQLARLSQWGTLHTLRRPLVWVLHLAYAWLPIGLALKAVALLSGAAIGAFWLHALTIGALTTMIIAVMSRAALGHTGRPLIAGPPIVLAYGLLTAAAVVRVFGLAAFHVSYLVVILWAAILWSTAFALFVGVYAPILCGPRIDGKPG